MTALHYTDSKSYEAGIVTVSVRFAYELKEQSKYCPLSADVFINEKSSGTGVLEEVTAQTT